MKKFSSFTIGGVFYSVEYLDQLRSDSSQLYGRHYPTEAKIRIARRVSDEDVNSDVQEVTFFHELLHAILLTIDSKLSAEDEESIANKGGFILKEFFDTVKYKEVK